MSAMTDPNLYTLQTTKKRSLSQTTGKTKLIIGKMYCIKLLNQQILHARDVVRPRPPLGSPSAFPSGGSKVIRGIIARKEGEPGNEARCGGS